jgi:PAS domain S-box-containing protein
MAVTNEQPSGSMQEFWCRVHPEDRARIRGALESAERDNSDFNEEFRVVWPDGVVRWLRSQGKYFYAANGEPERMLGISVDITDQKQTETELRESEERFRLAAQAGKMYAYEWDVATDSVVRSEEHINVLGFSDQAKELSRQQLLARVHPDERELFIGSVDQLTPENPTTQVCYRVLRPDGSLVWLEKSARAFFDEKGGMLRVVGMVADVTERKLAEAALATVSRRLIEAQEQERSRIARELHDDIGQRLSLLTSELGQLEQNSPDLPAQVRSRTAQLGNQASEIASDIQSLSHELHSSKLQYLGIVAAIRGFCRDLNEQHNVEIDFEAKDVPRPLASEISLCLFRVVQEALHNSAKHSGVRHFQVQLRGTSDGIHLTVSDAGVGFDVKTATGGRGLGLTSMQERVRLVNGTIRIESKPMAGTNIHVRVPFTKERNSARAAGK